MNFFKRLFSSKPATNKSINEDKTNFEGIYTDEYFKNRYAEENINAGMLDGCLKMIESYFHDNKIIRKIDSSINHPANLDQVDEEGFGFILYCKAFKLSEAEAILFLAYAFSDYLIRSYGFKLYKDKTPEFPLRGMTLKYDEDGTVLSLYPFEYSSKVLNGNEKFSELADKIKTQLKEIPEVKKVVQKFINPEEGNQ